MINYRVKQVLTNDTTWWAVLQEGEKRGFIYAETECYLQPKTVGRHCPWANHYLQVSWWSLNQWKEIKFAPSADLLYDTETCLLKSYVVNFHTQISWHKYLTRALSMKFSTLGHIHNFLLLLSSFFFSSAKSRFRLILQNNQISQW